MICHSVHDFMDFFKALHGVIYSESIYRPAVRACSILAVTCHQNGKVRCFVLPCDCQPSDFILSLFSHSPCLCFHFHFLSPAACPAHSLYVYVYLSPSLFFFLLRQGRLSLLTFTNKLHRASHSVT